MTSTRRAVFVLCAALGGGCCGNSPTEPSGSTGASVINLTVETPPVVSDIGTLTMTSSVCGCTPAPLIVAINGNAVGTIACSAQQSFSTPPMEAGTATYRILVTNGLGVSGLMSIAVSSNTPGAPSLAVRAFCP